MLDTPFVPAGESPPLQSMIKDDKRFNQGDFTSVSSDKVRFRVASTAIMAASPSCFDTISLLSDNERTVHFTDPHIEREHIVRRFLRLIVTGRLGDPDNASHAVNDPHEEANLIFFLKKYQCRPWVVGAMSAMFRVYRQRKLESYPVFLAACATERAMEVVEFLDDEVVFGNLQMPPPTTLARHPSTKVDVSGGDFQAWPSGSLRLLEALRTTVFKEHDPTRARGDIFLEFLGLDRRSVGCHIPM